MHLDKDNTQLIIKNTSNRMTALSGSDNSKELITHLNMSNGDNYIVMSIDNINSVNLYEKINNLYSADNRTDIIESYKNYLIEEGANKHSINAMNPIINMLNSKKDTNFSKKEEDMLLQFDDEK